MVQTHDGTVLEATALDEPFTAKDGSRLVEVAEGILARMNCTAKLRDAGYQPVTVADRFHRENHQHVMVYDEACIRDSISVARAGVALWGSRTQAVGVDQQFQATRSYSLMSPPSTGWRLIRGRSRFGTG